MKVLIEAPVQVRATLTKYSINDAKLTASNYISNIRSSAKCAQYTDNTLNPNNGILNV